MKKKVISVVLASMVALSLGACGDSPEPAATQEAPAVEEQKEADVPETTAAEEEEIPSTEEEEVPSTEADETGAEEADGFTILDVTADLVDAGIYAVDDSNTEYVITLFHDPDQNPYISLMQVAEDGSGDLICGAYDDTCVETIPDEENGVDWTVFNIIDVYTEADCTIVFAEGDDGSVAIANADFSLTMEGEYLSEEDTITYMGVAAAFIE